MNKYSVIKRAALLGVFAGMAALTVSARAETIYIGDAANYGADLLANGKTWIAGDSASKVTFVFTQTDRLYFNPTAVAQQLQVTEVNFYAASADASNFVRPFVATWTGANTTTGTNYTLLWIGDDIAADNVAGLKNITIANAPIITLNAGEILVAGYCAQNVGGLIRNDGAPSGIPDYVRLDVFDLGVNDHLSNAALTLDRTMAFNIGFVVIPEPATLGLLMLGVVLIVSARLLRCRD
ncbi:MAG: PEP-CTERM sorting domain-containing protein [Verrucomicrobiales bacterium]|nr:PEP-CTERM sorting domain-containing protein [Verrucomicrobiales bacterium]